MTTTEERPAAAPTPEELAEFLLTAEALIASEMPETAASSLQELQYPDQAVILSRLSEESRAALLYALPDEAISRIIGHLPVDDATEVFRMLDVARQARVLDNTAAPAAADILRHVEWEQASPVLARMQDRKAVGALLLYQDDAAGGIMTPEVTGLPQDIPVTMALSMLRGSTAPHESHRELFAVDREGKLVGALDLAALVFASPEKRVRDVMEPNPVFVEAGTDQEECARLMARYEMRSLPVVDTDGQLIGAIAIEDVVDVAASEATEDMFHMVGISAEQHTFEPMRAAVRSRLPWLVINLGTVMLSGFTLGLFESTISAAAKVAVFIPVIMGQAGIAGTQTLTLIIRSLALGLVDKGDTVRLFVHELRLGIAQGVVIALLLGAAAFAWKQDPVLAGIAAFAMLANLGVAAASGVLVPLGMRAAGADPATSSAVVVTTLTDVLGLLVYLGLATTLLTLLQA